MLGCFSGTTTIFKFDKEKKTQLTFIFSCNFGSKTKGLDFEKMNNEKTVRKLLAFLSI